MKLHLKIDSCISSVNGLDPLTYMNLKAKQLMMVDSTHVDDDFYWIMAFNLLMRSSDAQGMLIAMRVNSTGQCSLNWGGLISTADLVHDLYGNILPLQSVTKVTARYLNNNWDMWIPELGDVKYNPVGLVQDDLSLFYDWFTPDRTHYRVGVTCIPNEVKIREREGSGSAIKWIPIVALLQHLPNMCPMSARVAYSLLNMNEDATVRTDPLPVTIAIHNGEIKPTMELMNFVKPEPRKRRDPSQFVM